jgi:diguanylate cyclase
MSRPTEHTPTPRDGAAAAVVREDESARPRDLRFVNRIYRMRTLGLGLGFLCVASVFRLHNQSWLTWGLLVAYAFLWPPLARLVAMRSVTPLRAELRHLALDSALGGVWIALMQFNLLPSVLLMTMLSVDKVAVGGVRFALRTNVGMLAACAVASAILGFSVDIATPMSVIAACIPFLVAYPLAISHVTYGLANRIGQQNRVLAGLSNTDHLTGLANRRQGFAAADHALALHRRTGVAAVLVVLDIDQFKAVNDRYGHPAGDEILRQLANTLRRCSRTTDTPVRHAGDEFLLVLPHTDLNGAAEMSRRIRALLAELTFLQAPGLQCTISLGAAEAHREMADVEDWIQQADAALYRAKEGGRDRLVCAPSIDTFDRRDAAPDAAGGGSPDARLDKRPVAA